MKNESEKITSFTKLIGWQKGHKLVPMIYAASKNFPQEEMFALTIQMRRGAISITSNIAEGFSRYSPKEKVQFYYTALGSLTELQNQLLIARDVGYLPEAKFNKLAKQSAEVHKILNGLIKKTKVKILDS